ncbi:transcriptional regulator, DeoR family [Salinihabitans flavidus]|uniref:Transcriptional regulator, DeoR family n=1 Tax=Salinihabitans flavidus TaxID=569882 RepID=A0A1H8U372_9RHOB|nr:DeoR/GlpR family DNA-binding transcription regulator [Salinihabitans flavidus]SEO97585.1 transcriptional regulator, DeoR family [Salinihabitans flavidus]
MIDLNDRQREIVALIRRSGLQSINRLADRFGVATQTIRRDINGLCDHGLARRVHGGVVAPSNPVNLNFSARRILNEDAKRAIARAAACEIPNGSTVLLGIGTTVQYTAEALMEHADLTIITNNLEVATLLCIADSAEVHLLGGILRSDDRDVVGGRTLHDISRFVADVGVIGAGALDPEHGITDFKSIDAEIGRAILAQSRRAILVADGAKWKKRASHRVAGFDRIDSFVTDAIEHAAVACRGAPALNIVDATTFGDE